MVVKCVAEERSAEKSDISVLVRSMVCRLAGNDGYWKFLSIPAGQKVVIFVFAKEGILVTKVLLILPKKSVRDGGSINEDRFFKEEKSKENMEKVAFEKSIEGRSVGN